MSYCAVLTRDAIELSSFTLDPASIALSIKYHEFTPLFSQGRFELPKAFFATAQSVRDALIVNWNATYDYYEKMNGRALLNAIGCLELTGAYRECSLPDGIIMEDIIASLDHGCVEVHGNLMIHWSHKLMKKSQEEPDVELGNGGLGRLASSFLDSLATINYPSRGYGLRYKYSLFKQRITKDGQEEVAEDWLELTQQIISESEYGTSDSDLLVKKLNAMRILENVDVPASIVDLFVKPRERPVAELSEEFESSDEELEPSDEDEPKEVLQRKEKCGFGTNFKTTKDDPHGYG
ncbi:glycosyl transferase, family 35 [Actinidia rufa]|uniref:Alpha-1,4 glucan phosphorylase n=1 Tax=Actinidia rufa TaxID=165716 RepID=A0A7J0H818_9ERIC|nr:glycosyl transferase, family 35 [Actinidia rufa]